MRRKRLGLRIGWLALAVALVLGPAPTSLAATHVSHPETRTLISPSDSNARGFDDLGECLATAHNVNALYVVDVSGSLRDSDPRGARFEALEASVAQLGNLGGAAGDGVRIRAGVSYFGDGFTAPGGSSDWSQVTPSTSTAVAKRLRQAAEGQWDQATHQESQGTNYQAALEGARKTLRDAGTANDTCRIVFWFTDGLFSIGPSTDNASKAMCMPGGLLDSIRAEGISVVALALYNSSVSEQLSQSRNRKRVGELQAMAVGQSASHECGTHPVPPSSRAGVYLKVDQASDLALVFSAAVAQSRGGVLQTLTPADPLVVAVSRGIRSIQVDAQVTGTNSTSLSLTTPSGRSASVALNGTPVSVDGSVVQAQRSGSFVTATIRMEGDGLAGNWQLDAGTRMANPRVFYFSGLRLVLKAPDGGLQTGRPGAIAVDLVTESGEPADLTMYSSIDATAAWHTPKGTGTSIPVRVVSPPTGHLEATITPPGTATQVMVQGAVTFKTAQGVVLPPVVGQANLSTVLPAAFPSLEPVSQLQLGQMRGVDPVRGTILASGSAEGPTSVCFGRPHDISFPQRATSVSVELTSNCIALAKNEVKRIPVVVTAAQSGEGPASAVVDIKLNSATAHGRASETAEVELGVAWDMTRPVDATTRDWLFLLLLGASLLLPLLALWAVNRRLARFSGGPNLRAAAIDVEITPRGLVRRGRSGRPEDRLVVENDLNYCSPSDGNQRVEPAAWREAASLVARSPLNPLSGPTFEAVAGEGRKLFSSEWTPGSRDDRPRVTAGLGSVWIVAVSDVDDFAVTPRGLLLVVGQWQTAAEVAEMESRVQHDIRWSEVLAEIAPHDADERLAESVGSVVRASSAPAPDPDDDPFA